MPSCCWHCCHVAYGNAMSVYTMACPLLKLMLSRTAHSQSLSRLCSVSLCNLGDRSRARITYPSVARLARSARPSPSLAPAQAHTSQTHSTALVEQSTLVANRLKAFLRQRNQRLPLRHDADLRSGGV